MTRKEVVRALDNAINALKAYRSRQIDEAADKAGRLLNEQYEMEIAQKSEKLLNETRALGPAGNPCSRCGGTGREPT